MARKRKAPEPDTRPETGIQAPAGTGGISSGATPAQAGADSAPADREFLGEGGAAGGRGGEPALALAPVPAAAGPAPAASVEPEPRPAIVVTGPKRGRRRAGRLFGAEPVSIPVDKLSQADLAALMGDPDLVVAAPHWPRED